MENNVKIVVPAVAECPMKITVFLSEIEALRAMYLNGFAVGHLLRHKVQGAQL